ncbi:MAG: hypothetical protein K2H47_10600 [Muribaculaceae bacterium]|nr:hypothetical protein [Muribaculaceae bacterium]
MNNHINTSDCKVTDSFSFERMTAYLRFYCRIEGRTLLYAIGTLFSLIAANILITVLTHLSAYRYNYAALRQTPGFDPIWRSECNMALFILILLFAVAGSMVYGRFSTKSSRLEVLTVPATGTEKLTAWLIIYIAGSFVAWFVCMMCADILRVLLMHIFTPFGSQVHIISPWRLLTLNEFEGGTGYLRPTKWLVDIYGLTLFLQSVFAVGSIYLPRYSFFKTSCTLMILLSIAALMTILGMRLFFGDASVTSAFSDPGELTKSRIIWSAIGWIVASCLLYWLGYARMKQTEVALKW